MYVDDIIVTRSSVKVVNHFIVMSQRFSLKDPTELEYFLGITDYKWSPSHASQVYSRPSYSHQDDKYETGNIINGYYTKTFSQVWCPYVIPQNTCMSLVAYSFGIYETRNCVSN